LHWHLESFNWCSLDANKRVRFSILDFVIIILLADDANAAVIAKYKTTAEIIKNLPANPNSPDTYPNIKKLLSGQ
jgi:hypothetical protein